MSVPLERYYCRASTEKLQNIHHIRYTFHMGILLRNKSDIELHMDYFEPIADSITFTSGQTFRNQKSHGKKTLPQNMRPNDVLRAEWDDIHETDDSGAKPAFVKYRVIVKFRESQTAFEYNLNISSPEYRV